MLNSYEYRKKILSEKSPIVDRTFGNMLYFDIQYNGVYSSSYRDSLKNGNIKYFEYIKSDEIQDDDFTVIEAKKGFSKKYNDQKYIVFWVNENDELTACTRGNSIKYVINQHLIDIYKANRDYQPEDLTPLIGNKEEVKKWVDRAFNVHTIKRMYREFQEIKTFYGSYSSMKQDKGKFSLNLSKAYILSIDDIFQKYSNKQMTVNRNNYREYLSEQNRFMKNHFTRYQAIINSMKIDKSYEKIIKNTNEYIDIISNVMTAFLAQEALYFSDDMYCSSLKKYTSSIINCPDLNKCEEYILNSIGNAVKYLNELVPLILNIVKTIKDLQELASQKKYENFIYSQYRLPNNISDYNNKLSNNEALQKNIIYKVIDDFLQSHEKASKERLDIKRIQPIEPLDLKNFQQAF